MKGVFKKKFKESIMKGMQKFLGLFALSVALIVSGCGKKRNSGFKSDHSMHANDSSRGGNVHTLDHDRVFFELNKYDVADNKVVEYVVSFLKNNPHAKVRIEGFCDNCGTFAYNMQLSKNRAISLMNALVSHGIDASRIVDTVGYGFQFRAPEGQGEVNVSDKSWSQDCGKICASNRTARVVIVK